YFSFGTCLLPSFPTRRSSDLIYEVYVGDGEDEVSVGKLRNHLIRLPRNYNKNEVYAVSRKIEPMDATPGQVAGMPKGPMPRQAQNMAGMTRRMRRAQARRGKEYRLE